MTNPQDLAAEVAPWLQECGSCDAALPMACTCPKGDHRVILLKVWRAYEEATAALPHLRVQETPAIEHSAEEQWYCPTSNSIECHHAGFDVCCDAPEKHAALSFDLVEKAVVAYHASPHPRPVVDREAIWRALYNVWQNPKERPIDFASEGADAILALLPTEEGEGS